MLKKIQEKIDVLCLKTMLAAEKFRRNEEGDTNFISIMIILGIVVVFAGLFVALGKDVITDVRTKITTFLGGLGG